MLSMEKKEADRGSVGTWSGVAHQALVHEVAQLRRQAINDTHHALAQVVLDALGKVLQLVGRLLEHFLRLELVGGHLCDRVEGGHATLQRTEGAKGRPGAHEGRDGRLRLHLLGHDAAGSSTSIGAGIVERGKERGIGDLGDAGAAPSDVGVVGGSQVRRGGRWLDRERTERQHVCMAIVQTWYQKRACGAPLHDPCTCGFRHMSDVVEYTH